MNYLMKRVIYFACLPEAHHRIVMWCCWPWHGQHGASQVVNYLCINLRLKMQLARWVTMTDQAG
jgi:hypothetical protein